MVKEGLYVSAGALGRCSVYDGCDAEEGGQEFGGLHRGIGKEIGLCAW